MKIRSLVVSITAFIISTTQVYAIPSSDLQSVNNGVVDFNSATKTTTVTTNATKNSVTDVYWNRLNVGSNEILNNSFSATGQTIIHRVMGNDLSTIAGQINSIGIGAGTGKVVLINPNGVIFNGAVVNVSGLLVSTLGTSSVSTTGNQINLSDGKNKDIQIINSTINAYQGAAFVTNGNINVKNSAITTHYNANGIATNDYGTGNIQLVTADGVNFIFVTSVTKDSSGKILTSDEGAKAHLVIDSQHISTDPTDSIVTSSIGQNDVLKAPKASTIALSNKSTIDCGNGHVILSVNNTTAATSDVIVYGTSAIKDPKGAITITASSSNSNYGNLKLYQDVNSTNAKGLDLTGTHSIAAQNINIKGSLFSQVIHIQGNYDIASGIKSGSLNQLFAGQIVSGTPISVSNSRTSPADPNLEQKIDYHTDCTKNWTANKNQAQIDAEAKAAADAAAKLAAEEAAKKAAEEAAAKLAKEQADAQARAQSDATEPVKYMPKINSQQPLALNTDLPVNLSGAAAKVRRKQNAKFIGYPDKFNPNTIKCYEVLK